MERVPVGSVPRTDRLENCPYIEIYSATAVPVFFFVITIRDNRMPLLTDLEIFFEFMGCILSNERSCLGGVSSICF